MKSVLLAAAAMGFALTSAYADCNYHKSVSAENVDGTTVASVTTAPQSDPAVLTDEAPSEPVTDVE
jgi:hypothetical protein